MAKLTERPVRTTQNGDDRLDHPAFAVVSVTRVHGGSFTLFGAPVKVNSSIELCVKRAHAYERGLSEHPHADGILATVRFSETQWAAFVSSMNHGDGVPATLEYGPPVGSRIAPYPGIDRESDAEKRSSTIDQTMKENLEKAMKALAALKAVTDVKGPISKTELKEAVWNLDVALKNAPANFRHAADQVTQHMDKIASTVKLDLNAHAMALGMGGERGLSIESGARGEGE